MTSPRASALDACPRDKTFAFLGEEIEICPGNIFNLTWAYLPVFLFFFILQMLSKNLPLMVGTTV